MIAGLASALACALSPQEVAEVTDDRTGARMRCERVVGGLHGTGWQELRVELENPGETELELGFGAEVSWSQPGYEHELGPVAVGPGEVAVRRALVPSFAVEQDYLFPYLRVGARKVQRASLHSSLDPDTAFLVAVAGEAEPRAGWVESRAAWLGVDPLPDLPPFGSAAPRSTAPTAWGRARLPLESIVNPRAGTPGMYGAAPLPVGVQFVRTETLPVRAEAYSCAQVWVLDRAGRAPSDEALEACLRHARLGGVLLVAGGGAFARWQPPGFDSACEPRFELARFDEAGGATVYRYGLGYLVDCWTPPLEDTDQRSAVHWILQRTPLFVHASRDPWSLFDARLTGVGEVHVQLLLVLLAACVIVLGPVNLVLAKRAAKPTLLLLSVPATALAMTLVLGAYGLARDGIGVHEASASLTVLDQRSGRVSVGEARAYFAALGSPSALRLGQGTVLLPRFDEVLEGWGRSTFRVREEGGLVLSGGFLPARRTVRHTVLTDRTTRQRLSLLGREASGWRVRNDFDVPLEGLCLADGSGDTFATAEPLAPGEERILGACSQAEAGRALHAVAPGHAFPLTTSLPPASFVARLPENPFRDVLGIETKLRDGDHGLLGILPRDAFAGSEEGG